MYLNDETYESIKRDVCEFLEDWGITEYPIDPFAICDRIGIQVKPYSSLSGEASYIARECFEDAFHLGSDYLDLSKIIIAYNDEKSYWRIRYNISHELGHIVRGHNGVESEWNESEAQFFAGYLLAPIPLVIQYCSRLFLGRKVLYSGNIVDCFDISPDSADVAKSHAESRQRFGGPWKDYEYSIVSMCTVKGKEMRPLEAIR